MGTALDFVRFLVLAVAPGEISKPPRCSRRDKVDWSEQILKSKKFTLVVESQLYTAGSLVSFDAYTIGKLPNHKGR